VSTEGASQPVRAGPVPRWAITLALAALVLRTLANEGTQPRRLWYAALMAVFLLLFALAGWQPRAKRVLLHAYLLIQSVLILVLLALNPEVDSVTGFFGTLAFQAALLFGPPALWIWIGIMSLLTAGSLALFHGVLEGLAFAMTPIAASLALPVFMIVNRETEVARARSQALLAELEARRRELQSYAGRVEELATLRERSRLARELHDSVSQMVFSIVLTTRSAQLLLEGDPQRVRAALERLRDLSSGSLKQLRSLITQLRP